MTQKLRELELYTPHAVQLEMHESTARYRVGSWGRQSGKSTWGNNELLRHAWENPNSIAWFISPTYDQAKIQFRRMHQMLWDCAEVIKLINHSDKRIVLMNDAEISFKSGEVFENLRGATLHKVVIDEVREQHPDLWPMIIRPMLATTGGRASFISTPSGFDSFYDLFEEAKNDKTGAWATFQAPSTCNPLFTQDELEQARRDMSEPQFAQEIMAEFRDMTSGRAYTNYSAANDRTDSPFNPGHEYTEHLPVYCFMDFNLAPMAWVLAQNKGTDVHFTDEIFLNYISDPYEPARNLISKLKALPFDIKRHGLQIIGDASGKATQRTSMQSDYDIVCQMLDQAGIRWMNKTPAANPSIKDRVNTVNARLCNAQGGRHITLNPVKCPMLKRDFQRVSWKKTETIALDSGPKGELGHISDAAGYGVYVLSSIHKPQAVGGLKILVR